MIKKYIYCLLLLVSCLSLLPTLYGCQMKEDDLFEMDAANRSDAWMADYRRVFNNNKYGWALYTDNPTYGRHPSVATYAVKFDQVYSTYNYSTERVAKGDFIRMKEISLDYTFPKAWIAPIGLQNVNLKFQATNLFLIYADKKLNGNDPEFFNTGGVASPMPRQFTFTVRLGF